MDIFSGVTLRAKDDDFGYGFGVNYQIPNSENLIRIGFESYDFREVIMNGTEISVDKIALTYLF